MAFWCQKRFAVYAIAAASLLAITNASVAGPAIGQFELKDLEAEPGTIEFQSQNAHSFGQPRRKLKQDDDDDELIYDENSVVRQRHALELEATFTRFLRMRVGIEYEKERLEEPDTPALANAFDELKLDEVALEGVLIIKPIENRQGIGFGALAEVEKPLEKGELSSIVFGPIVEVQSGQWSAVANLLLVHFFGRGEITDEGLERDDKWDFAYAGQVMYEASDTWSFAVEAYGTVDRLGNSGRPGEEREAFGDHDQHRIGPLVYYRFNTGPGGLSSLNEMSLGGRTAGLNDDEEAEEDEGAEVSIGVGMLFGLTKHTPDATLKWSVEVEF